MATYVILSKKTGPDKDPEALFVRDGFSVLAGIFPLFWLLWHRIWAWALLVFVLGLGVSLLPQLPETLVADSLIALGTGLFFALEGTNMRIRHLGGKGYQIRAIVEACDLQSAEDLYFQDAQMLFASSTSRNRPAPSLPKSAQGMGLFDSYGGI